jgi:CheY-like chemotaxis protein
MNEKYDFHVDLDLQEGTEPGDRSRQTLLFHCVRELLLNAVKHSGTKTAQVRLWRESDEEMSAEVSDGGTGFDSTALGPRSHGLASVQYRVDFLGGKMELITQPGKGTRVILRLPERVQPEPVAPSSARVIPEPEAVAPTIKPAPREEGQLVRVMVVDDHKVLREGLAEILRAQPDMELVGEASDGVEAFQMANRLRPDVVIMDISMQRLDGIRATRRITKSMPQVRVIGLSTFEEAARGKALREAGAIGYVSKSQPAEQLLSAIREAVRPGLIRPGA